ncbi:MAG: DUF4115 domain-containing protein [Thermoanaerobaculia bacterium]|nr:DUF4115 domain-containing protein [Thermoanaerobaculia bacterium]
MPESDRDNGRQPPWASKSEGEQLSFGNWLRRQREIREIPLREIADVTKISMRYLEGLEQDRFDILPAPVFAKGFLREYSRYVGLDPDEVVNSFLIAQRGPEEDDEESGRPRRSGEWASGVALAAGVLGLLVLIAFLVFYGGRDAGTDTVAPPPIAVPPVPEAVAQPQAPVEAAAPPSVPRAPIRVTMDFTEDCWLEASVDGESRLSELHVQGESLTLEAQESVLLTLGNPGGVRIEVNGVEYRAPFRPGRVARDVQIDLTTVEELEQKDGT